MKKTYVKLDFVVNPKEAAKLNNLTLDNYEVTVRSGINKEQDVSRKVYLKHLMPKKDLDQIILELCTRITWDGHTCVSFGSIDRHYVFSGEPNTVDLVSEATYRFMV